MSPSPSQLSRETEVINAIQANDIEKLQELSLLAGGFGSAREEAWPFLLGVVVTNMTDSRLESHLSDSWTQSPGLSASASPRSPTRSFSELQLDDPVSPTSNAVQGATTHPDKHQVRLDTDRSFVLYPVERRSIDHRKLLQEDLHNIILGVLQKRPTLRYFQGYHDIITVLFLTLPLELVLPSAEKLSLHRVRDSMGNGLDPIVGQLRILKRLLRLIDPSYAEILERNAPLPYYALSNLLTLFSHDMPTLPLIQHVFDWLLCREPVAAIWLASAVILSRKEDILALEREGEEAMGMMHAVLSALPLLSEGDVPSAELDSNSEAFKGLTVEKTAESSDRLSSSIDAEEQIEEKPVDPSRIDEKTIEHKLVDQPIDSLDEWSADNPRDEELLSPSSESLLDSWTADSPRDFAPPVVDSLAESQSEFASGQAATDRPEWSAAKTDVELDAASMTRSRGHSQSRSRSRSHSRSIPGGYTEKPAITPLPLPTLLSRASELLDAYPPSSPALRLAETFGFQSALRTCDASTIEALSALDDDVAETYVGGDDVVRPPSEEEQDEEFGRPKKPKKEDRMSRRGKGRPIRLANGMVVRRQTVVASVVLLLGVAVALYGLGSGGRGAGRNGLGRFGNGGTRWVAAWVGGLLGVGQRLGIGL